MSDKINRPSPCINQCFIKEGVCTGCGRKPEDIWTWDEMTPQQRKDAVKPSQRYLVR